MNFPEISYLEWAKTHMDHVQCDLAISSVHPVDKREFPFPLETMDTHRPRTLEGSELVNILADRYRVEPKNIWVTGGVSSGLFLTYSVLLNRGDTLLLEAPNYEPLYRLAKLYNAEVRILDRSFERNFQFDLEELERKISRGTRAIILTNPHNPSGAVTDQDKLTTITQIARDYGCMVIIDEVYRPPGPRPSSSVEEHTILLHSFSKMYGLRDLHAGWIIGPEDFITRCRAATDYVGSSISSLTEQMAVHALKNSEILLARTRKIIDENMAALKQWMKGKDSVQWIPPDGGTTAFVKLPHGVDAMSLSHHLRTKYQTLVVPGDFFWIKGFIRVSLGAEPGVFRTGLERLGRALDDFRTHKK